MPEEGVTHRVCSVIASRDKDSVPGVAIDKHNEKLMSDRRVEGPQCPLRAYPMDLGTVWCLSSLNNAHNRSPADTVGSSGQPLCTGGNRLYRRTGC